MSTFKLDCMAVPFVVVPDSMMSDVSFHHGRRFTLCRAAREIFTMTNDPEIRERCRYISMLADAITRRLAEHEPEWLRSVYPRRSDFGAIMEASTKAIAESGRR